MQEHVSRGGCEDQIPRVVGGDAFRTGDAQSDCGRNSAGSDDKIELQLLLHAVEGHGYSRVSVPVGDARILSYVRVPLAAIIADEVIAAAGQFAVGDDLGLRIAADEVHVNRSGAIFLRGWRCCGLRCSGQSMVAGHPRSRCLRGRMQREDRVVGGEEYRVTVAPRHVLDLRIGLALVRFKGEGKSSHTRAYPGAVFRAQRWRLQGRCGSALGARRSAVHTQASGDCDSEGS